MSINVGGEIGLEIHEEGDQFIRVEEGKARILMGDAQDALTFDVLAEKDFAILIPGGK